MKESQYDIPVLFIVFKRLDTTIEVFDEIKRIKPNKLYIASDGPRKDFYEETILCENVKNYIIKNIDWNCEVFRLFREQNVGATVHVSESITWFFAHEEKGIILEDDTLPNKSFWIYMKELLTKYEFEESIMHINGLSPFKNKITIEQTYVYSKCLFHCWGWGTWRRAWNKYDFKLEKFKENVDDILLEEIFIKRIYKFLFLRGLFKGKNNLPISWDGVWVASCIENEGFSIVPVSNLIINLGLNHQYATHTTNNFHSFSDLRHQDMILPIKSPKKISVDKKNELVGLKHFYEISVTKVLKIFFKSPFKEILNIVKVLK